MTLSFTIGRVRKIFKANLKMLVQLERSPCEYNLGWKIISISELSSIFIWIKNCGSYSLDASLANCSHLFWLFVSTGVKFYAILFRCVAIWFVATLVCHIIQLSQAWSYHMNANCSSQMGRMLLLAKSSISQNKFSVNKKKIQVLPRRLPHS